MLTTTPNATTYCLYCDTDVPVGDISDEHIWPDALGGGALPRFWRTKACAKCNNRSGVYVDGAFIKSWIGMAERTQEARRYLSVSDPLSTPILFSYMASLPDEALDGETLDVWVLDCGSSALHFRPETSDEQFVTYAGGDPRVTAKKKSAGRAYLTVGSPVLFWQQVAVASFRKQFKKAKPTAASVLDLSLVAELKQPDTRDPAVIDDLTRVHKVMTSGTLRGQIVFDAMLGARFQAKLGLAVGHALFGNSFGATPYGAELRRLFRETDPEKMRSNIMRGSGIIADAPDPTIASMLCWPGGWLLLLKRQGDDLCLTIVSPSGRPFSVVVSDDVALTSTLDASYDDGLCWITVPPINQGVGPIGLPDLLAHRLGAMINQPLAQLEARQTDLRLLPECGLPDAKEKDAYGKGAHNVGRTAA